MINRAYEPLDAYLQPNKVLLIYGPRRVGKTTLLRNYLSHTSFRYKLDSGDNIRTQQVLGSQDFQQIIEYVEGYDLLALDEAQNIPSIGMGLKILVDQIPNIRIIATGSASFELAGQVGEPLTGRKVTLALYPIAQSELLALHNRFELREHLEDFLLYGTYPEVILEPRRLKRIEIISEIANAYLLKDILALDQIKGSRTLWSLLQLLAFQVGSEVSANELSRQLGINVRTVQRYLDLLEKAFVIIRLGGLSRNLRKEITSKAKFYFYDNGIRNAIISQFNPLAARDDVGKLWENFCFTERIKYRAYTGTLANHYFWRTYDQQEIDLVEEREGQLSGFEFKWSEAAKPSPPRDWLKSYPNASFKVITSQNYQELVLPPGLPKD
ncbi:MAG: ATP-binding protein [Anaerolineae bacterium]